MGTKIIPEGNGIKIYTERLVLKEMSGENFDDLYEFLSDPDVMYAWEHEFTEEDARAWLNKQRTRYAKYGFGAWGVFLKGSAKMIGQCGVTMQPYLGGDVPEIGYILNKNYWGNGYATEAASAAREAAFGRFGFDSVYAFIRTNNFNSVAVARRLGMRRLGVTVKIYRGKEMPHYVYFSEK